MPWNTHAYPAKSCKALDASFKCLTLWGALVLLHMQLNTVSNMMTSRSTCLGHHRKRDVVDTGCYRRHEDMLKLRRSKAAANVPLQTMTLAWQMESLLVGNGVDNNVLIDCLQLIGCDNHGAPDFALFTNQSTNFAGQVSPVCQMCQPFCKAGCGPCIRFLLPPTNIRSCGLCCSS